MKKVNRLLLIMLMTLFGFLIACKTTEVIEDGECIHDWTVSEKVDATCTKEGIIKYECSKCHETKEEAIEATGHDLYSDVKEATCLEDGYSCMRCRNCNYYEDMKQLKATGHKYEYVVDIESINGSIGKKHRECMSCHESNEQYEYVNIGYSRYGKLHVQGKDLVDKDGNIVQLFGLSTHGLQWYGKYVNKESLLACKEAFNINVFRFSLYTSENGYCVASASRKEELYQLVIKGVQIATELDMYAIVDWHMLGANDPNDKNPLYYKDEALAFFDRVTKDLAEYDNVFYEIMNEPCGKTTWADCKSYAEEVIPVIRNNVPDAIVLVGNPKWSSDLSSPAKNPLSFDNIMYTFHFYAADSDMQNTSKVTSAYQKGLPIFVTEHGGMDSDGDGSIDYNSIKSWYTALDNRKISYVAWNISNSNGSSAILKTTTSSMDDFSDSALKIWGQYYKAHIKQVLGLSN